MIVKAPSSVAADPRTSASPKVLIVAPNASSRFGGESFLPLQYFRILKKRGYPAKLIAHQRNQADLSEVLKPWLADVSFVPDTIWHRLAWSAGRPFPRILQEMVFGRILSLVNALYQRRMIWRLVRAGDVDVIHEPIPVSPKATSAIHGFGKPVIIGPMNGGMDYPPGYEDLEGRAERHLVHLLRSLAWLANLVIPGKRRAAVLAVANARTRAALPLRHHPRVIELVENGVDLSTWTGEGVSRPPRAATESFRLVFMGRLVDWKVVKITLQALCDSRRSGCDVTLDILGDGPERPMLEALAQSLGLADCVRFHGFQPQAECARILGESHGLILNSVRECGGAVVIEAMSLGLPVIASDWGGPADYIDPSCGILVSPVPRADFAARLSQAIQRLARDPDLCHRMGEAGRAKILREYDWEKKVDRMVEIYRSTA